MYWRVERLDRRDRWKEIGPLHRTSQDADTWAEANKKDSWADWRTAEIEFWQGPTRKLRPGEEPGWSVEVLHQQQWQGIRMFDDQSDATCWARVNREDWWEDWQVVEVPPDNRLRFDRKWLPEPNSGCWLWMGGCDQGGYGLFFYDGRQIGAHRAAWLLYRGQIAKKEIIRQRCRVLCCVNPDHLEVARRLTGVERSEMLSGRPHEKSQGEDHYNAELTARIVEMIRADAAKKIHHGVIAEKFGTSIHNVRAIVSRKTWKHL